MSNAKSPIHEGALLIEGKIWDAPHIVQQLRFGSLTSQEFIILLAKDLATGWTPQEWSVELAKDGALAVALQVAEATGVFNEIEAELTIHQEEWGVWFESEMIKIQSLLENSGHMLTEEESEQIVEIVHKSEKLVSEGWPARAISSLEEIEEIVSQVGQRVALERLERSKEARAELDQLAQKFLTTIPFPGGPEKKRWTQSLLTRVQHLLLSEEWDAAEVKKLLDFVHRLCDGAHIEKADIQKALGISPTQVQRPRPAALVTDLAIIEEPIFSREWTDEEDSFLAENYHRMDDAELASHFNASEDEIQKRLEFQGLTWRDEATRPRWGNPYITGGPVRRREMFFGREDIFRFIEANLGREVSQEQRNVVVLQGHRRTGKTSILYQLERNRRHIIEPRIPVFIDFQHLPRAQASSFFRRLALEISKVLRKREGVDIPDPELEDFAADVSLGFDQFVEQVREATNAVGLLLMLDEFQYIDPNIKREPVDPNIYRYLRHLMQHESFLNFILTGTMRIEEILRLRHDEPLFGSAMTKEIALLDRRDARGLVIQPAKDRYRFEPGAVEAILDTTSCHPYFVQLLCWTLVNYLMEHGKTKVHMADIRRLAPIALSIGRDHVSELWWTDTSDVELYILSLLAQESDAPPLEWVSVEHLQRALVKEGMRFAPVRVEQAVDDLVQRRILVRSRDMERVRFQVDLFRQWVKGYKQLPIVQEEVQSRRRREEESARRKVDQSVPRYFKR